MWRNCHRETCYMDHHGYSFIFAYVATYGACGENGERLSRCWPFAVRQERRFWPTLFEQLRRSDTDRYRKDLLRCCVEARANFVLVQSGASVPVWERNSCWYNWPILEQRRVQFVICVEMSHVLQRRQTIRCTSSKGHILLVIYGSSAVCRFMHFEAFTFVDIEVAKKLPSQRNTYQGSIWPDANGGWRHAQSLFRFAAAVDVSGFECYF